MLENNNLKNVVVIGYSGHSYVVVDAAISSGINVTHYSDENKSARNPFKLNYLGHESDHDFFSKVGDFDFILGIGNNNIRKKIYGQLKIKNQKILNVIHPSSEISKLVIFGKGNFVSKNTSINSLSVIKDGCIINTGAIIEHECIIGDFAHIGPGSVLAGNVSIGECSFIGANSIIKEGVKIGKNAIIGAGSVVLKNVLDGQKLAGNPAKII